MHFQYKNYIVTLQEHSNKKMDRLLNNYSQMKNAHIIWTL